MTAEAVVRIVDDDADHCEALSFMLMTVGLKSRTYTSAADFLAEDDLSEQGCIVLDYLMPGLNGIELQELLVRRNCKRPVLFLTAHADVDMAISIFKKGANDLLKKPVDARQFLTAVTDAIERDAKASANRLSESEWQRLYDSLTQREKQIASLVATGLMNSQVAKRLSVSERTVETHRANVYRKLGISSLSELIRFVRHVH